MVAARTCRSQSYHLQKAGEIVGVGGGTDLSGFGEFVVGLSQIQHGLYEVPAVYAKHPGDAR